MCHALEITARLPELFVSISCSDLYSNWVSRLKDELQWTERDQLSIQELFIKCLSIFSGCQRDVEIL
jgi:hypothetical protein